MSKHSIKFGIYILPVILAAFTLSCGFDTTVSKAIESGISPSKKKVIPKALITDGSRTVNVNATVTLDGTPSFDPQQEKLTYAWTLDAPNGSAATLGAATTPVTSFIADKGGYYTATLQVTNESAKVSEVKTVVIDAVGTGGNHPPVAIAGADMTVTMAESSVAALDGSASHDADGDDITYEWFVLGSPPEAVYEFVGTRSITSQLYPSTVGTYTIELRVSDGIDQDHDKIVVTAE